MMIAALPGVAFAVNLILYYGIWWAIRLTSPAEVSNRDVGRSAIFDEFEFGYYDIKWTVLATVVVTLLLLAIAWAMSRRRGY